MNPSRNLIKNLQRSSSSILSRIVTSKEGKKALVHFLIVENESGIQVRVLSVEPIAEKEETLLLCGLVSPSIVTPRRVSLGHGILSPLNDFTFFTSQPTRAPSRA